MHEAFTYANALRQRHRLLQDRPTEIHYAWQRSDVAVPHGTHTSTDFLTRYQPPETTFASVSIPLPSQARPGQEWRLGLFAINPLSEPVDSRVSLVEGTIPLTPGQIVGVWSEGIKVTLESKLASQDPVRSQSLPRRKKQKSNLVSADSVTRSGGPKKIKDQGEKQSRITRAWVITRQSSNAAEAKDTTIAKSTDRHNQLGLSSSLKRDSGASTKRDSSSTPGAASATSVPDDILRVVEQTSFDLDKVRHARVAVTQHSTPTDFVWFLTFVENMGFWSCTCIVSHYMSLAVKPNNFTPIRPPPSYHPSSSSDIRIGCWDRPCWLCSRGGIAQSSNPSFQRYQTRPRKAWSSDNDHRST